MRKIRKFKDLIKYQFRISKELYDIDKDHIKIILRNLKGWSKIDQETRWKLNFFLSIALQKNQELEKIIKEATDLYDNNFFIRIYFWKIKSSLKESKRRLEEEKDVLLKLQKKNRA